MIPGPPPTVVPRVRSRAYGPMVRPMLAAMVVAGLGWAQDRSDPPAGRDTRATLADLLVRDHGLVLQTDSIRPAANAASDTLQPSSEGQGVFFSARRGAGGEPDVFRAEAKLGSDGRVLDLFGLSDLTQTPFAAESLLAGFGPWSLYDVRVQGQLQSVLLVDERGDERTPAADAGSLQRLLFGLTNYFEVGRSAGVGLRLYSFVTPPASVTAEFHRGATAVSLRLVAHDAPEGDAPGAARPIRIRPDTGEVQVGEDLVHYEPRVWTQIHLTHWCANFLRSLPFVGPRPVALLERWAFTGIDYLHRAAFAVGLEQGDDVGDELSGSHEGAAELFAEYDAESPWPPPPVKPLIDPPVDAEGRWVPFGAPWLRTHVGAPPPIYKTALRTDPDRPRSLVILAAVDMRQVDLSMVAGSIEPHTTTGRRGTGRFPRERPIVDRVVAAFNGGFQTAHGAFGMMVDRHVVMPPMEGMATLAVRDDGHVLMGAWNNTIAVPKDLRSFRQNLPPLVADGVWNPTKKKRWGGTISDLDQVNTTRSAVAVVGEHTLLYAWGASLSAEDIGRALLQAGADYGMHLDMNPFHAGFWLLRTDMEDLSERSRFARFDGQSLSKKIQFEGERFVQRNAKDFFYLTLRRLFHERLPPPPRGFSPWQPHRTTGLRDGFRPRAAVSEGDRGGDLLVALDVSDLGASLRPGAAESSALDGLGRSASRRTEATAIKGPVAFIDLGLVDAAAPVGLNAGGRLYWPPRLDLPALTVEPSKDGSGRLALATVVTPALPSIPHRQAVPSILGGQRVTVPGAITGHGAIGARRGHVLGFSADGKVAYYLTRRVAQVAELQRPLEDLGVTDAVALDPTDDDVSRVHLLGRGDEGEGVTATDPLTEQSRPLRALGASSTRLVLSALEATPRTGRMHLPDVELSRVEARRQQRMRESVAMMRQGLRDIANAKYRAYIEKVKLRREAQAGVKGREAPDTPASP